MIYVSSYNGQTTICDTSKQIRHKHVYYTRVKFKLTDLCLMVIPKMSNGQLIDKDTVIVIKLIIE